MPVTYPGTNPLTISTTPGAGAPGVVVNHGSNGVYALPLVVQGGDTRNAANYDAAPEADRDSIVWLGWRAVDWINGGDYHTLFTAQVTLGNIITFASGGGLALSGTSTFLAGTGTTVAFGGAVTFGAAATVIYTAGGTLTINSNPTIAGNTTVQGSTTYSGNGAYRVNRKTSVSAGTTGFAAEQYDTVWCYNSSASPYTIVLTDPNAVPLPEGIRCRFVCPAHAGVQTPNNSSGAVQIQESGGTNLGGTNGAIGSVVGSGPGAVQWVDIETVNVGGTIKWDVVMGGKNV